MTGIIIDIVVTTSISCKIYACTSSSQRCTARPQLRRPEDNYTDYSIGAFYPDFSTGSLPIGVKRFGDISDMSSPILGRGNSPKHDRVFGVNTVHMAGYVFAEALVAFNCYFTIIQ